METQTLEGTFEEVQRQLNQLPYAPEKRLRIFVTAPEELPSLSQEPFRPTEFRNGVPLLPRRSSSQPVTLERVKQLSDEEDEELLRAYRIAGH